MFWLGKAYYERDGSTTTADCKPGNMKKRKLVWEHVNRLPNNNSMPRDRRGRLFAFSFRCRLQTAAKGVASVLQLPEWRSERSGLEKGRR